MREDNRWGGWVPVLVFTGAGSAWEQREGMGPRMREDNGGDGRFANRPYGRRSGCMGAIYFDSNHGGGRPRGTPLRGLGKIRKWEGRCGQGEGGMGPRMREDNGGGWDGERGGSALSGWFRGGDSAFYCQTASRMPMTAYETKG